MKYNNLFSKKSLVLLLFVVFVVLLTIGLTACTKKIPTTTKTITTTNTSKCSTDDDCAIILAKTLKNCTTPYCAAGTCKTRTAENCCGNKVPEPIENNLTGSKCSCPADYGSCNATIKYEGSTGKLVEAKYINRVCKNDQCLVVYDDASQRNAEFFNIWAGIGFTVNVYVRYPNLFYRTDSMMQVEMKLTDYDDTRVRPPIVINEIRLMEGSTILFRSNPENGLFRVGDSIQNTMIMDFYDFVYPEEQKTVLLSVDYEYTPLTKTSSGGYKAGDVERKTYTVTLRDKITFLDKSRITE